MNIKLYWFSGTGNSLSIARKLKAEIPEAELIPIIKTLREHKDNESIDIPADIMGVVFPVYVSFMPAPVSDFLRKADVSGCSYIFGAATCYKYPGYPDIQMKRILKKKGARLSFFTLFYMTNSTPCGIMPKWLPGFRKSVEKWASHIKDENIDKLKETVEKSLASVAEKIKNRVNTGSDFGDGFLRNLTATLLSAASSSNQTIPYYSDTDCTGCGICERVCPSGKVKITDGRPLWQDDVNCYYCYSCFNFCPVQSILLKDKYLKKEGRYHHPEVAAEDIERQKI